MIIRAMRLEDVAFMSQCTLAVGWVTETQEDALGFFAYNPGGCLVAEEEGQRIGTVATTPYGDHGFIGNLIVLPEWRGRGIGRELLDAAIDALHRRGVKNVLLDGVDAAISLYERAGFRRICPSHRFSGMVPGRHHAGVRPMQAGDLDTVCELDREAFGGDRSFFLRRRFGLYPRLCLIEEQGGALAGFLMARSRPGAAPIGPWIVRQGLGHPARLIESLAAAAGADISLGVLDTNQEAVAVLRAYGLAERPNPAWRMVLGPDGSLGTSGGCYAVGSAAKG